MSAPRGDRSRWWLPPLALVAGLGLGIALGLLVSWVLWPVEYTDVGPDSLHPAHRAEYVVLIAQTYARDGDLASAQVRLAAIGDPSTLSAEVATLAERYIAEGGTPQHTRALSELAMALGHPRAQIVAYVTGATPVATWTPLPTDTPVPTASSTPTYTPTPKPTPTATPTSTPTALPTPTPTASRTPTRSPTRTPLPGPTSTPRPTATRPTSTATPLPTRTARPTHTPTATSTPVPRYAVIEVQRTCEVAGGQLMVMVLDAEGQQAPGVELLVRWEGGDDRFHTGLKPEIGPGYADLTLEKAVTYQVVVIGAESEAAQDIVADTCEGKGYLASWRVTFQWTGDAPG